MSEGKLIYAVSDPCIRIRYFVMVVFSLLLWPTRGRQTIMP